MKDTLLLLLEAARQRSLPCLSIRDGKLVILYRPQLTIEVNLLIPEEMRSPWFDLLQSLDFHCLQGAATYAQFDPGRDGLAPVDLLFLDAPSWQQINSGAGSEASIGEGTCAPTIPTLDLQKWNIPPRRKWPKITFEQLVDETESLRQYYINHFSSLVHQRPNPEPFRM